MTVLAFDLGASSGKALLGRLNNDKLEIEEIHRFPNDPVFTGERLCWDILRLLHEVKQGLQKAHRMGAHIESMAIDSWAVDFGLLDVHGELLGNPVHYRDTRTDGVMEQVFKRIPPSELFARSGIQFLPFNTLYQLYAMHMQNSVMLREAKHFLMIPDLLRYFLTGEKLNEFSNATTTQFYNPAAKAWDKPLLDRLGIPSGYLGEILMPGTMAGRVRPAVQRELGIRDIPVIAVAEHDTGSAVAAVPATDRDFAYLSCGTWSLLGTEVDEPVLSEEAQRYNFTNEGGVGHTFRLLKNIMGLWIVQECRRFWEMAGTNYSFAQLVELAEQAPPFVSMIDPDDDMFLQPGDMPARIQQFCQRTGQPIPQQPGEMIRTVLESLAFKYRYVLERVQRLSGKRFDKLHMVGGGIHNELLCRFTANAIARPVWAGPAEGSAIGNILVQYMALGRFKHIGEARQALKESIPIRIYEPEQTADWNDAYSRFVGYVDTE